MNKVVVDFKNETERAKFDEIIQKYRIMYIEAFPGKKMPSMSNVIKAIIEEYSKNVD